MSKDRPKLSEQQIASIAASIPNSKGPRTAHYTSEELAAAMPNGPRTARYSSAELAAAMPTRSDGHAAAIKAEVPPERSK